MIIHADVVVVCRLWLLLNAQDRRKVLQFRIRPPDKRTVVLANAGISIGL
jgi:hypothetical protein